MIRARFFVEKKKCDGDYRLLIWPIQYPYWCRGGNDRFFILVAYVNDMDELMNLWPEASDVYIEKVNKIFFSDRFPKPYWYKELNQ